MIPAPLATFLARPLVKYGGPVVLVMLAVVGFKLWLASHDRAVRAEYLSELKEAARKESEKAAAKADKASSDRKAQTDAVQESIANSSSVDELFDSLRRGAK